MFHVRNIVKALQCAATCFKPVLLYVDGGIAVGKTSFIRELVAYINKTSQLRVAYLLEPEGLWNPQLRNFKGRDASFEEDKILEICMRSLLTFEGLDFKSFDVMIIERSLHNHQVLFHTFEEYVFKPVYLDLMLSAVELIGKFKHVIFLVLDAHEDHVLKYSATRICEQGVWSPHSLDTIRKLKSRSDDQFDYVERRFDVGPNNIDVWKTICPENPVEDLELIRGFRHAKKRFFSPRPETDERFYLFETLAYFVSIGNVDFFRELEGDYTFDGLKKVVLKHPEWSLITPSELASFSFELSPPPPKLTREEEVETNSGLLFHFIKFIISKICRNRKNV